MLSGRYFFAVSLTASVSFFTYLMTFLLEHTGFASAQQPLQRSFFWILWAIMLLLASLFKTGLIHALYRLSRRETAIKPGSLFYAFHNQPDTFILIFGFRYLITLIWFVPAVFTYLNIPAGLKPADVLNALLPVLGLALAGILPALSAALPYCLSVYILLDSPLSSVREALKTSRRLMKGQKKRVISLWISFLPLYLTGIGSYGMAFFWIQPYYHATMSQLYLDITHQALPEEEHKPFTLEITV